MFGTLRHDVRNNDIEFVERENGYARNSGQALSRRLHHSACDKCRAKKVLPLLYTPCRILLFYIGSYLLQSWLKYRQIRCTGQSLGCVRCKTLSIPCVYSSSRKGKGPQQIKSPVVQMREVHMDTVQSQAQSGANSSLDSMPATATSHTQAQTTMLEQQNIVQVPIGRKYACERAFDLW